MTQVSNICRRSFLKTVASAFAWMCIPKTSRAKSVSGYFNAVRGPFLPQGYRVFIDGVDVSDVSDECHVDHGWVRFFPHHHAENGSLEIDIPKIVWNNEPDVEPVKFRRYGKVEVLPRGDN